MRQISLILLVLSLLLAGCGSGLLPTQTPSPTTPPTPSPMPTPTLPPVEGSEPSMRVAAFYYPWYRSLEHDGEWIHWEQGRLTPPRNLASDYYPLLGPYSSLDRVVVAQHFAWMREAGVGVVVTSWWGRYGREDGAVLLLLEMGERYGLKVAFHIEPYGGRTAINLANDIKYLYERYGTHPAFYRSGEGSLWSSGEKQQGLFFVWAARYMDGDNPPVEPAYWAAALDEIHSLPDGGLVIADENGSEWVTDGHFDGSYKYGVLDSDMAQPYTFANGLPPGAWYIPGVNPGFTTAHILGYEDSTFTPRRDGAAYAERWQAMFDTGLEPQMVAIATFNEWHEGTQIEPAITGVDNGAGFNYSDYESLPPDGYITLTRQWVDTFLAYEWPQAEKVSFRITTTSDWTAVGLVDGGSWMRPHLVSASEEALDAGMREEYLVLTQPLERAETGQPVEMLAEAMLTLNEGDAPLIFNIARGGLGYTVVEIIIDTDNGPVVAAELRWDGFADNADNSRLFEVPVEGLGD